jgi:hypothetical protein
MIETNQQMNWKAKFRAISLNSLKKNDFEHCSSRLLAAFSADCYGRTSRGILQLRNVLFGPPWPCWVDGHAGLLREPVQD